MRNLAHRINGLPQFLFHDRQESQVTGFQLHFGMFERFLRLVH